MSDIVAAFQSHYSLAGGLLTLDEPGKAKPNAPKSVFDLSQSVGLKEVVLIEDKIDGFISAYKTAAKLGVKLVFGVKLVTCSNLEDKGPESKRTESKVVVFIRNTAGYNDLVRLWNVAWTTGHNVDRFVTTGRIDWKALKALWTPNLMLGLPFYSSFLSRNTLTFNKIVPDLPSVSPLFVMREMGAQLPFDYLINSAIDRFCESHSHVEIVPCKSIYYENRDNFKSYMVKRCIGEKASFDCPDVEHLTSDRFSFESWRELSKL